MYSTLLSFIRKIASLFSPVEKVPTQTVSEKEIPALIPTPIKKEENAILAKKNKIQSILNVFETGSLKGDYTNISIFKDGPGNIRQITYGKSQTTEWGNLKKLIELYVKMNGNYSTFFRPYLSKIGVVSLVDDKAFINKLKSAGSDPIMLEAQDKFFDDIYWKPAMKFVNDNQFTLPLSALVIYDSFIHSGGILPFLRKRFSATTPANKGDEKKWIKQYLIARQEWLANHSRPILRSTTYRTKNMLAAIKENNWNLDKPFYANGIVAQGETLSTRMIGIVVDE